MSDSVGSVSVEVRPDARGWSEKLRAQIRDTTAHVNVDADTGEAAAQIDEVARDRKATIEVSSDKSQLSGAATSLDDMVKNVSLLPALFVAAGAAAVPLAATVGGLAAALAAPLAVAGGGVGLFAIFGALAAKQTESQLKNIDTLQKKLSGLTKGTATYAATQKELLAAQQALTPAQHKFADSLDGLKGAFSDFLAGKTGQTLLTTIASGMDLLSKTLPVVAPVLAAVSKEFGHLLDELGRAAGSKGFADFIHDFARQVGPDIDTFAHVAGNLAKGFGGLFLALDNKKLSGGVLDGLLQLSQNFAHLGQGAKGSQWLKDFIDYFHKVGPQVADTVGAVARAVGHLVSALAPLGPPVLKIVQGLADALSSIPTGTLTGLLGATAVLSAGGYAAKKGSQLGGFLGKIPGLGGVNGGVQKVYVTNPGFGATGVGGKTGIAGYVPGISVIAAAAAIGFAKGHSETAAMGGKNYAQFAVDQVRDQQKRAFVQQYAGTTPHINDSAAAQAQLAALKRLQSTYGNLQFNNIPRGAPLTSSSLALKYGLSPQQARGLVYSPQMKATSTALDAITANAARASRGLDMIGPHAQQASATATHAVSALVSKLGQIHDEKFTIIAQTQNAVNSLERLQAMTIKDKHFTVTELFQQIERHPGPGGGIQHHALGGFISGAGSGSSDSIASMLSNGEFVVNAAATSRHRDLLEQLNRGTYHHTAQLARYATMQGGLGGGTGNLKITGTLNTPWGPAQVEGIAERAADRVYHANRSYEDQAAGR